VDQLFICLLGLGKLYIWSLPPELVALHVLRKLCAGGSGVTERWGFRVTLVGMWLMVIGVFADYSWVDVNHLGFGFFAQMAATAIFTSSSFGRYREMTLSPLQQFYSSFTVNPVNSSEPRRTQIGLGKGISNRH
jgi:hypothetical protein